MPSLNYDFVWKDEGKVLVFPVKVSKSIEEEWKGEDSLICPNCSNSVSQRYICSNCNFSDTIGKIKSRRNKETNVIFSTEEYNSFMKQVVKAKITVVKELPITDFLNNKNLEYIEGNFFELFNNDEDYNEYITKLHFYLRENGIALLCLMGYYSKNRAVVILPTNSKVLGIFLRDYRLIRQANATLENMVEVETEIDKILKEFSVDKNIDNYYRFLELKMKGEPIPIVKQEKKEEYSKEVDDFFKKKKKKVAIEV